MGWIQPWWALQLVGVAAVAAWLLVLALLAIQVRKRWSDQREWSRKLVHIGTGLVVLIAWGCGIDRLIALPAAATITVLAAWNHRLRLLPAVEDVGRPSYGTVAYGASITALLALFWPEQPAAVASGVLVMAWGDGLAGLLGAALPSPSWTVLGQRKSLVGTTAMASASLLVLLLIQQLAQAQGLASPGLAALVAIAAIATACEQVASWGIDNFSVPILTGWLWQHWQ